MYDRKKADIKYYNSHKKEIHQYYLKNRERILAKAIQYQQNHKEERKKYRRNYYKIHKIELGKKFKNYRKTHRKQHNLYCLKRRKLDINFKILISLRNRIGIALKRNYKMGHTSELIGCTINFLKKYLQKQFKLGMNWKNYGKWHIDHIKPCSSFDLSKKSEQKKCFHYTNLQPLWAEENLIKHNKYIGGIK